MMLRTLAAFGLGTLAASTAVASHAMTEGRIAGRTTASSTSKSAVAAAPTLAESILSMRDIDPSTGKRPNWSKNAQRLIDDGFLERLASGAPSIEAAKRARDAGIEQRQHEVIRPAVKIPKKPSNSIVVPYNLDGTPASTGRITLKYRDGLGARASMSGTTPVLSVAGQSLGGINQLLEAEGAVIKQLINHPESVIESVRKKAFERSGRVQPDLAAMMVVELPGPVDWDRVIRVARSINEIPEIDWVSLEPTIATTQECGEVPDGNTYCNLPRNTGPKTLYQDGIGGCQETLVLDSFSQLIPPTADGTLCTDQLWLQQTSPTIPGYWDTAEWLIRFPDDTPPPPGDNYDAWSYDNTNFMYIFGPQNAQGSWSGDLTEPAFTNASVANWAGTYGLPGSGQSWFDLGIDPQLCEPSTFARAGCEDQDCCDRVTQVLPECADPEQGSGWDVFCAAYANIVCDGSIYDNVDPNKPMRQRYDPCLSTYRPGGAADAPGAPPSVVTYEVGEDCPAAPTDPDGAIFQPPQVAVAPPADLWTDDPTLAQRLPVFQLSAGLLGNCFEPQITPGCSIPSCCASVCVIDISCCNSAWDQDCVDLATQPNFPACTESNPDPTPNYSTFGTADGLTTGVQAFMTAGAYQTFPPLPVDLNDIGTAFRASGYEGVGLDVSGAETAVGLIWRLYGRGALLSGQLPQIRKPDNVWLGGAEWRVRYDVQNPEDGWLKVDRNAPPSPENPFPDFAVDDNPIYDNMWLEPTGNKQQVAVCEFSAFVEHEEWCFDEPRAPNDSNFHPTSINVEAGQTLNYQGISNAFHGIACLGVTTAPNNGFGVKGIAPYAEPWFFPIESVEEGARPVTAMISMIQDLNEGAIINHSWGPTAPGNCLTSIPEYFLAITACSDAGLVVCLSAGNDGCALVDNPSEESPGAIIVGALQPGKQVPTAGGCDTPLRIQFSTHSGEQTKVTACAWGVAGGTTGYGDLFRGQETRDDVPVTERPFTRTYTGPTFDDGLAGFSGTSFASPQIAGCAALAQGAVRMFWGTTISGYAMAGLVANEGGPGGPHNCQNLGYPDECPQAQDGDGCNGICGDIFPPPPADPSGTLTDIGNFCNLASAISGALTIIEDPTQGSLEIYSGTLLRGNSISLTEEDGLIFAVRSELRVQGPGPEGLVYFASGETIDWGARVQIGIPPEDVTNMQLLTVSGASSYAAEMPFVFNLSTGRWQLTGLSILQLGRAQHTYNVGGFETGQAPSVFVDERNSVLLRMYTVGLGFINGGFVGSWDRAVFVVNGELAPL